MKAGIHRFSKYFQHNKFSKAQHLSAIVVATLLSHCAAPDKNPSEVITPKKKFAVKSTRKISSGGSDATPEPTKKDTAPNEENLEHLLGKLLLPTVQLSEEESTWLKMRLQQTQKRSNVEDALVFMACLQIYKSASGQEGTDPNFAKSFSPDTGDLATLGKNFNIDLPSVLRNNPYLHSVTKQNFVFNTLTGTTKARSPMETALIEALNQDAHALSSLSAGLEKYKAEADAQKNLETTTEEPAPALNYSAETFENDEAAMKRAEELTGGGELDQALVILKNIASSSPYYAAAIEKIRSVSNTAVQILRQKAAQSFQNAKPIADPTARIAYLTSARDYLNEAVTKFPDADQIETVKKNLSVIDRSIEEISAASKPSTQR